ALTLGVPPQLLELARGFVHRVSKRALTGAATGAALPGLTLRFGLLQLTLGQLLQTASDFVHLLRRVLLRGRALRRFVLVRLSIELQLEQIGEILRHLAAATTAATATLLLAHFDFVGLLGVLQMFQRALLGRERFFRLLRPEQVLSRLHLRGGLWQRFHDVLDVFAPAHTNALLQLLDERFDFLADVRWRQPDEHDVFLELRRRGLRLVAIDVEGRRNDLALLLRERARLVLLLTTAAATAA